MRPLLLTLLLLTATAQAQFQILPSPTTADLRGIHAVSPDIAWASGTNGTVLRTTDAGAHWLLCPTPPDAEHLDFRGIQAFDAQTAIVMSSGRGPLSRLYKTTDACATWTLLFTNPDPEGFWDAFVADQAEGVVMGDPVGGRFAVFASFNNAHQRWYPFVAPERAPSVKLPPPRSSSETLFAASNSVLAGSSFHGIMFATGGPGGSFLYGTVWHSWPLDYNFPTVEVRSLPFPKGPTAGAFSFSTSHGCNPNKKNDCWFVAIGGDYKKPDDCTGVAAYGKTQAADAFPSTVKPAQTPPHGYRSSVVYSPVTKTWITVGPNGTDISTDNGRNWRPLKPSPDEAPDSDRNWNALSLPYVVGPHGHIGKLRPTALQ